MIAERKSAGELAERIHNAGMSADVAAQRILAAIETMVEETSAAARKARARHLEIRNAAGLCRHHAAIVVIWAKDSNNEKSAATIARHIDAAANFADEIQRLTHAQALALIAYTSNTMQALDDLYNEGMRTE